MGYRHYFFEVNIADCYIVKHLEYSEFMEYCKEKWPKSYECYEYDDGEVEEYLNFHEILDQKCIFEFGKLYWDDTAERIYACGQPLFDKEETQRYFQDYEPYMMSKEGILTAIEIYKAKVINYYKSLLVDDKDYKALTSSGKMKEHVDDMLFWWEKMHVLDLDENRETISGSWKFEHQIFELVRLYKSIDWKEKCLLFYGY